MSLPLDLFLPVCSQVRDIHALSLMLRVNKGLQTQVLQSLICLELPAREIELSTLIGLFEPSIPLPLFSGVLVLTRPSDIRLLPKLHYKKLQLYLDYPLDRDYYCEEITKLHGYALQEGAELDLYDASCRHISEVKEGYVSHYITWGDGKYDLNLRYHLMRAGYSADRVIIATRMPSACMEATHPKHAWIKERIDYNCLPGDKFFSGILTLKSDHRLRLASMPYMHSVEEIHTLVCPCDCGVSFPVGLKLLKVAPECLEQALILACKRNLLLELYVPKPILPLMQKKYKDHRYVVKVVATDTLVQERAH